MTPPFDPDRCLAEIRSLLGEYEQMYDHLNKAPLGRLVEAIRQLDQWLSEGGRLPKEWQQGSEQDYHDGTNAFMDRAVGETLRDGLNEREGRKR